MKIRCRDFRFINMIENDSLHYKCDKENDQIIFVISIWQLFLDIFQVKKIDLVDI